MKQEGATSSSIILFDGDCLLCNRSLRWIIRRDRDKRFLFSAASTNEAERLFVRHPGAGDADKSILLLKDGKWYQKSTAVLKICRALPGIYPILAVFLLVPRFIRDGVYDYISRNRYRWFGKTSNSCELIKGYEERLLSHQD